MASEPEDHPSFPQPADTAQSIWRYMDMDKFEWLLDHSRLFMPTAHNLGDPLEGSTPPGQLDWWDREAENASTDEMRATITHNRQFFAYFAEHFRRHMYYVSCWHMNKHENYSMWRCYTKGAEAVAIKTTYSALRAALPASVLMGVIRYIDYSTDRLPYGNMFEYIMHKDAYYTYEAEVRAVMVPPPSDEHGLQEFRADHFSLATNPDFLVYAPQVDVVNLIGGIVLHPEASEAFANRIRDICAERGLPEPVLSRETNKPRF